MAESPIAALLYDNVLCDALVVRSRQEGASKKKSVYLTLGINIEGEKELLRMWINETEGSKFWLHVFNEMHNRGVKDCFIASAFPQVNTIMHCPVCVNIDIASSNEERYEVFKIN